MSPGEGLPIFPLWPCGEQPDCPSLRASDEHSFMVRVLRARGWSGVSLPPLLRPRVARAQQINRSILSSLLREHGTTRVSFPLILSCAFREQGISMGVIPLIASI